MIPPFKAPDHVSITWKHRSGSYTTTVRISDIERRSDKWYFGYTHLDTRYGAWGYGSIYDKVREYGIQAYHVIPRGEFRPNARLFNEHGQDLGLVRQEGGGEAAYYADAQAWADGHWIRYQEVVDRGWWVKLIGT